MKIIFPDIPSSEWSGISLRKGGATTAMRAGVPGETIEALGHWTTDVYKRYISHNSSDFRSAQLKMVQHINDGGSFVSLSLFIILLSLFIVLARIA